jgi:muramidase (phage lysozyme)
MNFNSPSIALSDFLIRIQALIDTIAWSEGTDFKNENIGYNMIIDGIPNDGTTKYTGTYVSYSKPNTLEKWGRSYINGDSKFNNHPNILIKWKQGSDTNQNNFSSAAGRYQILAPIWKDLASKYFIDNFSPSNQDKICLAMIERALPYVKQGKWELAITSICKSWPSLPGSGYLDQTAYPVNKILSKLKEYYQTNKPLSPETAVFCNQYFSFYLS